MKKAATKMAIVVIAATGMSLGGGGAAWAKPCASGERLVGKTMSAWLCMNIDTGNIREVRI
jgi:hypothetical protein